MGVMVAERAQNLKKVLDAVPSGYLVDAAWLTAHGIAYETFRDYVKRGWLERLTRGVFRRPSPGASASDTIDWKICLLSVQHIMRYDVHVGGMTALYPSGIGAVSGVFGLPVPRHKIVDAIDFVLRQALEDPCEPCLGVDVVQLAGFHERIGDCSRFSAAD